MASFEFVRLGMPCSVQSANKSRTANYKAELRRIARSKWDGNVPPVIKPIKVGIVLCFKDRDEIDIDNIIKPILDQLNGLVYEDDIQIVEINCRKFRLPVSDAMKRMANGEFLNGLRSGIPFVHVRVEWEVDMDSQQPDRVHETAQMYRADNEESSAERVSVPRDEIERLLSQTAISTSSRLVQSFAALEAALRLAFDKVGKKPRHDETYSLIVVGTSIAFLEQSEYFELTRLMKIRDAIVHGYTHEEPTEADVLLLAEVTHRVIVESETAKLEYDY